METIATTELSEPLQQLLTHIQRSNKPLTVTHQGELIAVIHPTKKTAQRPAFGIMQQGGEILDDLVESIVLRVIGTFYNETPQYTHSARLWRSGGRRPVQSY